jgi:two-component system response regulator YesN
MEFRHLLSEALQIFNHRVSHVENGLEALKLLEAESFDLIFSDITMSGMTGLEFTKEARKRGIQTPIIAITGHSDKSTIEKSLKNGISDYILKPLRIKDLPAIIDRNIVKT